MTAAAILIGWTIVSALFGFVYGQIRARDRWEVKRRDNVIQLPTNYWEQVPTNNRRRN